jgi:hypothetical protein
VGSSPIVFTVSDQGECSPSGLGKASDSRAIEHLSNIRFGRAQGVNATPQSVDNASLS